MDQRPTRRLAERCDADPPARLADTAAQQPPLRKTGEQPGECAAPKPDQFLLPETRQWKACPAHHQAESAPERGTNETRQRPPKPKAALGGWPTRPCRCVFRLVAHAPPPCAMSVAQTSEPSTRTDFDGSGPPVCVCLARYHIVVLCASFQGV